MSHKILAIGEVLWDLLPSGKQLGGAPANFAYHVHCLGAEARIVSRVGDDRYGTEILADLNSSGLSTDFVSVDRALPTGTVSVDLDSGGQPRYVIHKNVAWDHLTVNPQSLAYAATVDAVCFGTLAQRSDQSRKTVGELVSTVSKHSLRVFDINLRQNYYSIDLIKESLDFANALKLNESELVILADMFGLSGGANMKIAQLAGRFGLSNIALTRGDDGSVLLSGNTVSEYSGIHVKVVDTVGAGDAFTAAWTLGLLDGLPLDKINERANELAAFVCSNAGAMPSPLRQNDGPA
jgi:fructokinase